MGCVVSYPGVMEHAQHAALALGHIEGLDCFATTFAYREGPFSRAAFATLPRSVRARLQHELRRRELDYLPADRVRTMPVWEVLRTLADKAGAGAIWTDRIWDVSAHRFDAAVARRFVPRSNVTVAFEYTALASFRKARDLGKARVLHLPSLDSRAFHDIQSREQAAWPELRKPTDHYFERKFEERYARRKAEIALAVLVIANSMLTARSHIAAGADPAKMRVALLGGPPALAQASAGNRDTEPLQVIWAGGFTLGKGAHYLLDGWRTLAAGRAAKLTIYGRVGLPAALMSQADRDIKFMGSVPRAEVLEAYERADVMILPTLSDGFGMAVLEAMSRGVPVIVSDRAGAAELVESGGNGLVIPASDPAAIAQALDWCLANRSALRAMRGAALDTARRRQWSDYRRDVVAAMDEGLAAAGYGEPHRRN